MSNSKSVLSISSVKSISNNSYNNSKMNENLENITIEQLFNKIKKVLKEKNISNPNFNGKDFWQPLKAILAQSKWEAKSWKKKDNKEYINKVMSLPEYYIDGYNNKETLKENHFLIQTVRIPMSKKESHKDEEEPPNLKKIMQVALNIGQYLGVSGKTTMKYNKITDYITEKESKIKVSELLHTSHIQQLFELLQ